MQDYIKHKKNDAVKRYGKHKMYEAAACILGHAILQQTYFFYKQKEYTLK